MAKTINAGPRTRGGIESSPDDLRSWLDQVEGLSQLEGIAGAHWDLEIGALTELILERQSSPPALIYEGIPDHSSNSRILVNMLETIERTALALNLPTDLKPIPLVEALRAKLRKRLGMATRLASGTTSGRKRPSLLLKADIWKPAKS